MRNFLKIAEGVDTVPILAALAQHPDLWDKDNLRTTHTGSAHAEVSDIWLFFNPPQADVTVVDDREVVDYPAWSVLPQARGFVFDLMRRVEGVRLGRVIITRLDPGRQITPHIDAGAPATFFTRYQIVLQSLPGALFHCGDETVNFRTGEVWMVDNTQTHSVVNNSIDQRIVMICDIRSA